MPDTTATFAAVAVTLYAGHQLADHVLGQTDRQARDKTLPGWPGWRACLEHVAQYHLVLTVMLGVVWMVLDLPLSPLGMLAGLWWSGITHAILDRRWPVQWISRHTGSPEFVKPGHPLPGAYLVDQATHLGCLWISSLLVVLLS
jgi:hypothetical protein